MDKSSITKTSLNAPNQDFAYWQQQPVEVRLATLESIREEYNHWKDHDQQGFQRIYRVTKLA